jgi:epoxyqueuosine reductase
MALSEDVKSHAYSVGFDLVGIAPAGSPETFASLSEWLAQGFAGEMAYIERRREAYEHPRHVLPAVKCVVMLGMNYRTADPPADLPSGAGRVSRYAWGDGDYHDVIRDRLRRLGDWLHEQVPGCRTRGVVDTAPLLERDFARLAGLGWFGKNTMLINKRLGSWLFLAALLTDVELEPDAPHVTDHCGTCTACLDACPTDAFAEPYVLDATKCISYLTIELRDRPIPEQHREGLGEWLFGCDVCNDVCPWNRKAPASTEPVFQPREDLTTVDAVELLSLDEEGFGQRFAHTPLARAGRSGLLRNACLVLGNRGNASHLPALRRAAEGDDPVIRDAARWAIERIMALSQA